MVTPSAISSFFDVVVGVHAHGPRDQQEERAMTAISALRPMEASVTRPTFATANAVHLR